MDITTSVLARDADLRRVYAAHGPELYRFAARSLGDAGAAQDAVQETFLRAWRAGDRFDPRVASLRGWLFAILRNVVLDVFRAQRARPLHVSRELAVDDGATEADHGEQVMRRRVVSEALRRIAPDHRAAIVHTYLLDRPYDDVAADLGVPASTLRSRVFYGLKALRVVLEEMEVYG